MSETYFPAFLYLSLGCWLLLLAFFVGFSIHLHRLPDDEILRYKAKAIERKRKLGIRIFRF